MQLYRGQINRLGVTLTLQHLGLRIKDLKIYNDIKLPWKMPLSTALLLPTSSIFGLMSDTVMSTVNSIFISYHKYLLPPLSLFDLSCILNEISPVPPATSSTFRRSSPVTYPFSSVIFLMRICPIELTKVSFQHLCTPKLMASFIRSYDSATLLNTLPTIFYFSS